MSVKSSTANKVLDILMLFHEAHPEISGEAIGAAIKTPRSTTYRYIRTLTDKGFLEKMANGKYCLGPIFLQFGSLIYGEKTLGHIALPVMQSIMEKTNETVLLTRRFNRFSVCMERVESQQAIRITYKRGHTQPLHAGAPAKIILAFAGEAVWHDYLNLPLEPLTESTITDPETLRIHLQQIREQGFCTSEGEVDVGAKAIAVPILNSRQQLMAGLSTAGPAFRMDEDVIENHLELLRVGASEIALKLP
jgi:IclR family KDG regulon transcriptional repressor